MLGQILAALLLTANSAVADTIVATSFPNLIIPISSSQPDITLGTQYSGHIALWHDSNNSLQAISTELVFDNVPTDTGATYCKLDFTLAETGPFTHTGGPADFHIYDVAGGFIGLNDTWHSRPNSAPVSRGWVSIVDGQVKADANEVPCGQKKVQVLLQPNFNGEDFDFTWFELDSPINGVLLNQYRKE